MAHINVYNFTIIGDYCSIHVVTTIVTIKNLAAAFTQTPRAVGRSILNVNWTHDFALTSMHLFLRSQLLYTLTWTCDKVTMVNMDDAILLNTLDPLDAHFLSLWVQSWHFAWAGVWKMNVITVKLRRPTIPKAPQAAKNYSRRPEAVRTLQRELLLQCHSDPRNADGNAGVSAVIQASSVCFLLMSAFESWRKPPRPHLTSSHQQFRPLFLTR